MRETRFPELRSLPLYGLSSSICGLGGLREATQKALCSLADSMDSRSLQGPLQPILMGPTAPHFQLCRSQAMNSQWRLVLARAWA